MTMSTMLAVGTGVEVVGNWRRLAERMLDCRRSF